MDSLLQKKTVEIKSRYGDLLVFYDDLISDYIKLYGEWTWLECELLADLVGQFDGLIFDIGAYLGSFALGMGSIFPSCQFVVAEVNPHCWHPLERNLGVLKERSTLIKGGIGQRHIKSAGINLTMREEENLGSSELRLSDHSSMKSDIFTLSQLIQSFGAPGLIKLDVEGMEATIIQAAQDRIAATMPLLWVECNEDPRSLNLFEVIQWIGYDVYYCSYPAFNPDNFNSVTEAKDPFAHEAAFFASPPGREVGISSRLLRKGCFIQQIHSVGALRKAMWRTPRWGRRDWEALSPNQLVALLGRSEKNTTFDEFLE